MNDDVAPTETTTVSYPIDLRTLSKEDLRDANLLWEEIKKEPDYETLIKGIQSTRKPPLNVTKQRDFLAKLADKSASGIFTGVYLTLYRILLHNIKSRSEPISARNRKWNAKFTAETLCSLFILFRKWKEDDLSKSKIPSGTMGSAVVCMSQIFLAFNNKLSDLESDKEVQQNKQKRLSLHTKRTVRLQDGKRFDRQLALPDKCPACQHTCLMIIESREFIEEENERRRTEYLRKMVEFEEQTAVATNTPSSRGRSRSVVHPRRSAPYAPRVACFCCKINCYSQADGTGCFKCSAVVEVDGLGGHLKELPGTFNKVCTCEICTYSCEIDYCLNQRVKVARELAGRRAEGKLEETVPTNGLTYLGNILIDHLANGAADACKDSTKTHQDAFEKAAVSILHDERLKHNAPLRSVLQNRLVRPNAATLPNFFDTADGNNLGSADAPIELDLTQDDMTVARIPLYQESDSEDDMEDERESRRSRLRKNKSVPNLLKNQGVPVLDDAKPAASLRPKDYRFYQNRLSREKIDIKKTLQGDSFTKNLLDRRAKSYESQNKAAPVTPSPNKKVNNTGVEFTLERLRQMHGSKGSMKELFPTVKPRMRYHTEGEIRKLSEYRHKKIWKEIRRGLSIMKIVASSNGAPQYVIDYYRRLCVLNYLLNTKYYKNAVRECIIEGTRSGLDLDEVIEKIWAEFQRFIS